MTKLWKIRECSMWDFSEESQHFSYEFSSFADEAISAAQKSWGLDSLHEKLQMCCRRVQKRETMGIEDKIRFRFFTLLSDLTGS